MQFVFPTQPGGTLADLWAAVLRLLPQLGSKITIIRGQTIGTSETAVYHGVGFVPTEVFPILKGNATVWQSRDPDSQRAYFTASSAVVVDVAVMR